MIREIRNWLLRTKDSVFGVVYSNNLGKKSLSKPFFILLVMLHVLFAQDIFIAVEPVETVEQRFAPPPGFKRLPVADNGFAAWLRKLPLLPQGQPVRDYRNRIFKKAGDSTVAAVAAYNIRGRKLEQCMDIIVRLRAEYLWRSGQKAVIRFPLPEGTDFRWTDWAKGLRPVFRGAHFQLQKSAGADSSYAAFERYLNVLFEYSGSQAFYHYYPDIEPRRVQPGDFVVKKGKKGHAVLIVDMAADSTGNTAALIGQGDTPACQFYLLNYKPGNPWFPLDPAKQKALPLPIQKKMYWKGLRRFPSE